MKLFVLIQKNLAAAGFSFHYSTQKYHLNARNAAVVVILSMNMVTSGAYVFYGAESFDEYLENILITFTLAAALTIFIIVIVLMPKIFLLIDNLEQTINKSKCIALSAHFQL